MSLNFEITLMGLKNRVLLKKVRFMPNYVFFRADLNLSRFGARMKTAWRAAYYAHRGLPSFWICGFAPSGYYIVRDRSPFRKKWRGAVAQLSGRFLGHRLKQLVAAHPTPTQPPKANIRTARTVLYFPKLANMENSNNPKPAPS